MCMLVNLCTSDVCVRTCVCMQVSVPVNTTLYNALKTREAMAVGRARAS